MINIQYSSAFVNEFKRLAKKYESLESDLDIVEEALQANPSLGESLGGRLRKVRMAISSKNSGKSGGARLITLSCIAATAENNDLVLLAIYDKSELGTVKTKDLRKLAKALGY